ncbi:nucleoside phosphorylase [Halovenus halobia]|uniref:nucleoside phosphorylase n=1 Tax=Halovenus halobia TaxID=3396622 RepID=UPI003F57044C
MLPNYDQKYDAEALFSPEDALSAQGDGLPEVPPAVMLGYQQELTDAVEQRAETEIDIVRSQRLLQISETVGYVPVHEVGIGAPVTAIITENVIASGAEAVAMVGGSACLQRDIDPGTAILPTATIRDEGVSYHYIPDDEPVTPDGELIDSLAESFSEADFETARGRTWTTSAMYRETVPELEHYSETGVVSLCMETAAIWAVCQYRGVSAATVHEIGDYITPGEWTPETEATRGLPEMLDPAIEGLHRHVTSA